MIQILTGDCRDMLPTLPAGSVQCCVTSPPYWGLRDYGTAQWEGGDAGCEHLEPQGGPSLKQESSNGTRNIQYRINCPKCGAQRIDLQLGLESTPEEYITRMVAVFREVWRVLKDDGTLWCNMGDKYNSPNIHSGKADKVDWGIQRILDAKANSKGTTKTLNPKDLCGMPWRLALALQADGWYLRSDIIWHKPNPMPESVTDRPTKAHEYLFLLTKNGVNPLIWRARDTGEWSYKPDLSEMIDRNGNVRLVPESWNGSRFDKGKTADHQLGRSQDRSDLHDLDEEDRIENDDEPYKEPELVPRWKGFDYFYDADAIREQFSDDRRGNPGNYHNGYSEGAGRNDQDSKGKAWNKDGTISGRNKRSVWTIATQPYAEAHFATFPEDLIKPCILAGSRPGDTVLDPFSGSGTTGKVALELGRKAVLIELNPKYVAMIEKRTHVTHGML